MIFKLRAEGMGKNGIARELNRLGIPAKNGGLWHECTVGVILQNEKYKGDLLLQKNFRVDHINKVDRKNKGELPMYCVQDNHEAIIPREEFEKVQNSIRERSAHFPEGHGTRTKYPFSSKLKCALCGKNYKRRMNSGRVAWQCSTFMERGKAYCIAPQIRETVLEQISAEVLGLERFDKTVFTEQIKHVLIDGDHKLMFYFYDGRSEKRPWKNPSRSESWTPEMRAKAAERSKRRPEK